MRRLVGPPLLVVLACGLLLTACGGGGGNAGTYPPAVKAQLLQQFESEGLSQTDSTCVAQWLEDHMSYSQFQSEFGPNNAQAHADAASADAACGVSLTGNTGTTGNTGNTG